MTRRTQGKRSSVRDFEQRNGGAGECPECGKLRFLTKAAAKRAASQLRHRDGRLNAYRCGEFWHIGHLPRAIARGLASRDDLGRRPTTG
jgi:hypothetical protein